MWVATEEISRRSSQCAQCADPSDACSASRGLITAAAAAGGA